MKISVKSFVVAVIFLGISAGNGFAEQLSLFVSIVPQKFFVSQIGGDLVDVSVMVEPGASPASYEPKPRQMAALADAKIYFSIGVPFEGAWLDKFAAANRDMLIVHTEAGIKKEPMLAHHHDGDDGKSAPADEKHGILDPHVWTSPSLVKIQAKNILTALEQADPANAGTYAENYSDFIAKIDKLDADLRKTLAGKEGLQFMVFHPAWGYFAHDYALRQIPVEIEGKDPKPAQLQKLVEHAREHEIKVIFVQPQFSTKSAEIVAGEIGGEVVPLNPLAEDWFANMRKVAEAFQAAVR